MKPNLIYTPLKMKQAQRKAECLSEKNCQRRDSPQCEQEYDSLPRYGRQY